LVLEEVGDLLGGVTLGVDGGTVDHLPVTVDECPLVLLAVEAVCVAAPVDDLPLAVLVGFGGALPGEVLSLRTGHLDAPRSMQQYLGKCRSRLDGPDRPQSDHT
jgi:hypothetical protein